MSKGELVAWVVRLNGPEGFYIVMQYHAVWVWTGN